MGLGGARVRTRKQPTKDAYVIIINQVDGGYVESSDQRSFRGSRRPELLKSKWIRYTCCNFLVFSSRSIHHVSINLEEA